MNYCLKEYSQINNLGNVLQQFYKRRKVFETIVYFEDTLVLAPDKASQ